MVLSVLVGLVGLTGQPTRMQPNNNERTEDDQSNQNNVEELAWDLVNQKLDVALDQASSLTSRQEIDGTIELTSKELAKRDRLNHKVSTRLLLLKLTARVSVQSNGDEPLDIVELLNEEIRNG